MKTLYTAYATSVIGEKSHSETDDKHINVEMSAPTSGTENATNPEQIFAVGYSGCFGMTIKAIAEKKQVSLKEVIVKADVALNQDEKGGLFLAVTLHVTLAGVDDATAHILAEDAHQKCPYSKAIHGNVEVTTLVNKAPLTKAA